MRKPKKPPTLSLSGLKLDQTPYTTFKLKALQKHDKRRRAVAKTWKQLIEPHKLLKQKHTLEQINPQSKTPKAYKP